MTTLAEMVLGKHLPGKHDQAMHGRRGGTRPSGSSPTTVSARGANTSSLISTANYLLDGYPDWAKQGVAEVTLVADKGRTFQAGGKTFSEGGHWSPRTKTIRVFEATNQLPSQIDHTLGHEIGHSLFDQWWDRAVAEDSASYREHPDWFDGGGNVLPEWKKIWEKEYPLRAAQEMFMKYWGKEDGITPYSKAWAKDGQFSETVAEMSEMYFRHMRLQAGLGGYTPKKLQAYVRRTITGYGKVEGAPHLARAFVSAMEALARGYESAGHKVAVGYIPSFYGTEGKALSGKSRRFFDANMNEVAPEKAVIAIELEWDEQGRVVSSTRYVVGGGAEKGYDPRQPMDAAEDLSLKFNPYHDEAGRFASAPGGGKLPDMLGVKHLPGKHDQRDHGRRGRLFSRSPGSDAPAVELPTTDEMREFAKSVTSVVTTGGAKLPTDAQVEQVAHLLSQHSPAISKRLRRVALYESDKAFDKEFGSAVGKHGGRVVAFWEDTYDSISLRPAFKADTFHHEVGHQAWKVSSPDAKQKWMKAYQNTSFDRSTSYSKVSHREGFAESYSAFIRSGGKAISPKIQDTFKGVLDVISSVS